MKNRNLFLTVLFSTIIFVWMHPHILLAQNSSVQIFSIPEKAVQIIDCGNYYQVIMDYTTGISHYDMGVELIQKILQTKPDYEQLMDSYIAEAAVYQSYYNTFISRVDDIKPQMHKSYQYEIDGMASQLSGGNVNVMGDNKVSKDELYMIQLLGDVARATQCSGISVYGARSETGHPMTARILDWYDGTKRQLAQLQAVTIIKYDESKSNCLIGYGCKSICLIGYLGHLTMITGFNTDGVFAGILDSGTSADYSSTDKYSFHTDLRFALENYGTLSDVAGYVTNPWRNYTFNHNVLLSDSQTSKVLENNFSGTGKNMQRTLRSDTSALNPGITWGFTDAVATVNSFLLLGNHDNHTGNPSNMNRWESLKTQLQNYGETITLDELKQIASFDNNDGPGSQSSGDIYNSGTQQIVLFQPDNFHLEVAFRPKSGILPANPVFEKIPLLWKNNLAYGHTLTMDKKVPNTVNDTITINATVENPNTDEVSVQLILESLDGVKVDSVEMFPVDLAVNDSWQCKWIPESLPEDIYWLSLKVTDITDGKYFINKHLTRITNRPLTIGTLSYTESSDNKYSIKTELKHSGESMKIISPVIKITSDNPWITSITPEQVTVSGLIPGEIKRIPSSRISVDEATFPGYVNLKYTISEDGWPYWVIDTTIYFVSTGLEQIESPLSFNLEQNYPNPFNSVTTIPWQIDENSKVTLKVLDIVGRTVEILVDEKRPTGKYETQFNAATLPKGIYFYQLKAGENVQTRKMILTE
ncbi:MAG TPA: C45 family autoproteolytic acyltransferase/hydrolase [Draconibacterium sp.]|nr:C45 family autoproteolytic acyltransferase/hydrolase [Draconibacterium sp.]